MENNNVAQDQKSIEESESKAPASSTVTIMSSRPPQVPHPVFVMTNSTQPVQRTAFASTTPYVPTVSYKSSSGMLNCWKRKDITKREKFLSVSLVISCLVILFLTTSLFLVLFSPTCLRWVSSLSWESNKCLTPACVSAAADILKRIDKTVDPCEDFYKFSCGGLYNKLNPIPDDHSDISTASFLDLDIDKKIRGTN